MLSKVAPCLVSSLYLPFKDVFALGQISKEFQGLNLFSDRAKIEMSNHRRGTFLFLGDFFKRFSPHVENKTFRQKVIEVFHSFNEDTIFVAPSFSFFFDFNVAAMDPSPMAADSVAAASVSMGSVEDVEREAASFPILPDGFSSVLPEVFFGDDDLAKIASLGFTFFKKGDETASALSESQQRKNFEDFQKGIGAHYLGWQEFLTKEGSLKNFDDRDAILKDGGWLGTRPYVVLPEELLIEADPMRSCVTAFSEDHYVVPPPVFNGRRYVNCVFVFDINSNQFIDSKGTLMLPLENHRESPIHMTTLDIMLDSDDSSYSLRLTNTNGLVRHLGNHFLKGALGLISLDLSGLTGIKEVGYGFLSATKVFDLDLSPLRNIRSAGPLFLQGYEDSFIRNVTRSFPTKLPPRRR